ncbi:MAG: UDP-N-acetylmuramate:L-alanyl-gamma-D-glutamyl-meso-diaminopimelate ligase [Acidobacteria bacterium RIFCSPLOWO2_02_FULL_67_36]|nr:MAG: UDP-N-acetylmuramate:L-alanyl-gamma-D-glutamyl-meso-diaminopimelate ligase [Acidobacteria bacterium RIFCSPLOWO2_02_FULL_67_36]OFW18433.1 MAG: UDP-N-acetylmuramate:L-alanyl-gamma-D-glutamyl-meso-diaminopimelate ligase [Acidobacteria bacterium RIFCSPLOWO2_12_FULL_66_21]
MKRIHLIGICGTAMATLAAMLKSKGHDVRGSDHNVYPPMSDFLRQQDITILEGYSPDHITADLDLVVVGNAISRRNTELEEVLDRKIRYCSLPEAVRDHFLWAARSVVITGTHGKTTTTSLAGWLLAHGGADPSVLIGGIAENFEGSYRIGGGRDFVIEGDEYDSAFFDKTAKFLKYLPDIAVVGNIEFDHADIYADLDEIRLAFRRFVNLIPRRGLLLLGADNADALALKDKALCRVETFGLSNDAEWQAHDITIASASTTFSVRRGGTPVGTFEVPLLGSYNVRNALAAIAVGAAVGLATDTMAEGLRKFRGVRRRLQHRGTAAGVAVYDDFAHHPTAIGETLDGVRSAFPDRRIWAIFEPRSATACRRIFQSEFARALSKADRVVVPAVFRSTLPEAERLSPEALITDLQSNGVEARYIPQVDDIVTTVAREARDGDLVIVMSNGGFDDIHRKLLAALEARASRR